MTPCEIHPEFALNNRGYASFYKDGVTHLAHRAAWESVNGAIPPDLEIDHLCGVRACVNVEHLRLVTHRENLLSGATIAARKVAQTHCIRGHPFDEGNTLIRPNGTRKCRACDRWRKRVLRTVEEN